MNEFKGRMLAKIELTLEQSQQGVSYDVLVSIEGVEELKINVWIKGENKAALQTLLGRNQIKASHQALIPLDETKIGSSALLDKRTCGKSVAEIQQPNGGKKLWLGTFGSAVEGTLAYEEAARAIYGPVARINLPNYCPNASLTALSYDSTVTYIDEFLGVMVEYECSQAQGLKTTQNVSEATAKEVEVTGIQDKNFFDIDELLDDMNQKGQYDAWFENKVDGFDFNFLDTDFKDYNFTLEDLGISLDPAKPVM
nr:dehydration-responsive element-binding protein 2A-like [Tanacetum cinerariifolium]